MPMRIAGLALSLLLCGLVACTDDDDARPTPSPQAALTEAPTTPPTPPSASFRPFAGEIDAATQRRDAAWFQQRIITTHVVCDESNTPPGLGGPACDFIGQEFEGFSVGRWRSEGGLVPAEEVTAIFDGMFDNVISDAADEFGGGSPVVYAISDEGTEATAVITALVERPENFDPGGPLRVSLVTDWTLADGEWRMDFMLIAYVLGEEFLIPAPEVEGYLPNWERY